MKYALFIFLHYYFIMINCSLFKRKTIITMMFMKKLSVLVAYTVYLYYYPWIIRENRFTTKVITTLQGVMFPPACIITATRTAGKYYGRGDQLLTKCRRSGWPGLIICFTPRRRYCSPNFASSSSCEPFRPSGTALLSYFFILMRYFYKDVVCFCLLTFTFV